MERLSPEKSFDACMKLADFAAGRWDARRDFDWKLTFGIWALLVGAITYLKAEQFPVWVGVVFIALYVAWRRSVDVRNSMDREIVWASINKAHNILKNHSVDENISILPPKPKFTEKLIKHKKYRAALGFLSEWSNGIQLWFTVGLVGLLYVLKVSHPTWWQIKDVVISTK